MFILSGFGDEISPHLSEQLDVLEREGIKHLELRGVEGKGVLSFTDEEAKEIKRKLERRGFKVSAIASPIGKIKITNDFKPHLIDFKRALDLACLFETKYIRLFSYCIPEGEKPSNYKGEVIRRMKEKTELARQANIIILHENEKGIYGNIGKRCREILSEVSSPNLRAIFDPANFVQEGEKPYSSAYPQIKEFIEYVHIKDAKLIDGSVTPAGEGDGEVRELLLALKKKGFEGFLSLEPHLKVAEALGGFSGAELFKKASLALKTILSEVGSGKWEVNFKF